MHTKLNDCSTVKHPEDFTSNKLTMIDTKLTKIIHFKQPTRCWEGKKKLTCRAPFPHLFHATQWRNRPVAEDATVVDSRD